MCIVNPQVHTIGKEGEAMAQNRFWSFDKTSFKIPESPSRPVAQSNPTNQCTRRKPVISRTTPAAPGPKSLKLQTEPPWCFRLISSPSCCRFGSAANSTTSTPPSLCLLCLALSSLFLLCTSRTLPPFLDSPFLDRVPRPAGDLQDSSRPA